MDDYHHNDINIIIPDNSITTIITPYYRITLDTTPPFLRICHEFPSRECPDFVFSRFRHASLPRSQGIDGAATMPKVVRMILFAVNAVLAGLLAFELAAKVL